MLCEQLGTNKNWKHALKEICSWNTHKYKKKKLKTKQKAQCKLHQNPKKEREIETFRGGKSRIGANFIGAHRIGDNKRSVRVFVYIRFYLKMEWVKIGYVYRGDETGVATKLGR